LYAHASAALDTLRTELLVPAARIVLQGQSLGTGIAVEMAARGHGKRLVLISPYTSMVDMAKHAFPWLPVGWLVRDRYDSAKKAKSVGHPTLVIHGTDDEVIPARMGESLANTFAHATFFPVPGGHHNDLFGARFPDATSADLVQTIARFAAR
jgi:fermentation-respiration switch protein FrsA (DUF1100 family)